ncbi:MAG: 1-(5-phosphoribosyl)-5-[(5-phosphoribosylamino)methylideneamino] imidazole-4-carboxamide isomerase [Cyclobacteriaceae bacterium]|nr:1-(5-phosphoribosyl)-5-[(5-phosphoribosylamino)methylideneamino] imidazole-4-carboxamide isomerase [Cyclobacteriaceae bacterium]MCB0498760.1 1-(5-phosphoribosyl)-5-[(5-phosphoribosylamino)methylideneamino] imidazole-4-carboxamide isomerase [Cyclobacteriaceae bacterium]MCB9237726.1 1-(5-phosphoribosyl)-5-[(5-phosphoribosylamino)methylideneamino] imidazole-4-carboxamide isomerase [Flammeovirgaceae bacterium]MCO5270172.1 1-(5-phosphoribosyl)-5-[(5-phosphoribosylamino)methylideneamino] imidazole-
MIQIIPSIAIRAGKVVKMRKGDPASEKAYDENPLDLAKRFQDSGIEKVHLVDLDGAESGSPKNYHVLEGMCAYTDLKIDFTGGVSTDGDIGKAFEHGAAHVTVASIAVTNPHLFASWLVSYGREKVTLGADVTDIDSKHIAYRSWLKKSKTTLYEHIQQFYDDGLKYVKSTDVSRDGVLEGPAFSYYEEIISKFPGLQILASGGVRGIDDIKKLDELGLYAVIFGKAYYEGVLKLKDLEHFLVGNEG